MAALETAERWFFFFLSFPRNTFINAVAAAVKSPALVASDSCYAAVAYTRAFIMIVIINKETDSGPTRATRSRCRVIRAIQNLSDKGNFRRKEK